MNITFHRDGSAVLVKLTVYVPTHGECTYTTKYECTDAYYAGFLCNAISEQFSDGLSARRKEAYDAGWKQAKGKKTPKQTWFQRHWGSVP